MSATPFLARIARKGANPVRAASLIVRQPELLPEVLGGLDAVQPRIKYGCSKVLRLISEKAPALLYPHLDLFIRRLDSENSFLKWDAARIVARLAAVDEQGRIERMLDSYLAPIRGPAMITAANLIGQAADIALAKPELADRIARHILKVERAEYQTVECRNVAIGHAILALGRFFEQVTKPAPLLAFVRRQLRNSRPATHKKAADFLRQRAS